ncbi:MAG: IS30 family transposase [Clostridia bacterium]|nr:IS30 family transposase [Clostridia bacterium]
MGHCFSHLSKTDRYTIEALLRAKHKPQEIADIIHVNVSTIYREIKRARTVFRNSDWTEEERYNPDLAEKRYRENLAAKGGQIKLANDHAFAAYIEHKITVEHRSPAAALADIALEGRTFKTHICKGTLYSWIDKGFFLNITNKDLPIKKNKKQKYRKVRTVKKAPRGESIEKRPPEINNRETFGHWEGDTVYGGKKAAPDVLFTFTERQTLQELIVKMPNRTAVSGVAAVDALQARFGDAFPLVFKSITFDNGVEFSDVDGLERSATNPEEKRTKVYFCHPYSSYERGSNENQNRMIRRLHPKGTDLGTLTDEDVSNAETWINNYPRLKFGWKTSDILFSEQMEAILACNYCETEL